MNQLTPLLYGVALPLGFAALLWYGLENFFPQRLRAFLGGLALTLPFMAAQWALTGRPGFPPDEASQWLFWMMPALLILVFVLEGAPAWLRTLLTTAFFGGSLFLILRSMVQWHWEPWLLAAAWLTAYTLGGKSLEQAFVRGLERHASARWFPFFILGWISGAAIALAASGSLMLGQLAGASAAALGPLALTKNTSFPSSLRLVAFLSISLLAMGVCYAELKLGVAAGLLVLAWLPLLGKPKSKAA